MALDDVIGWLADPTSLDPAGFADGFHAEVPAAQRSARPGLEPLGEVLPPSPGADLGDAGFQRALFKGGAEPGVAFAAWWAAHPAGRGPSSPMGRRRERPVAVLVGELLGWG